MGAYAKRCPVAPIAQVLLVLQVFRMRVANDLLEGGMAFVTIIAEGRVYTIEEFALTILAPQPGQAPCSKPRPAPAEFAMSGIRYCRQRWPGCPRDLHARSRKISPPLSAASQISETTNGIS